MANTNLKMTVTADAKQAQDSLSSLVASIAKTTAAVTTATLAAKKAYEVCKELVEIGSQEALAEERLKAVITATGTAATASYGKMKQLASSISDLTGIEEQSVYAAEKVLVAFGSLNEEGFERTIQLSADVAMAMGTDMASAAQKLGQILATPTQGLDGLKEMGVAFTAQEQEQIKAVYEANGAYEAQALILDKVESAYGKSATAVGNSTANLLTKINETWTDIKTDLGKGLLDSISPALEKLYTQLEKISNWIKSYTTTTDFMKDYEENGSNIDMSKYSTFELEAVEEKLTRDIESSNSIFGFSSPTKGSARALIWSYLANPTTSTAVGAGADSYSTVETSSNTPTWQTYLSSYGSKSKTYQSAQIQATIDEITALRDNMTTVASDGKKYYNFAYGISNMGISSQADFKTTYKELGEIVTSLRGELESLNATAEDTTVSDLLSSYGSLSETFTQSQTDEAIANVKTALDGLADGDPAKTYLQEIYDAMTAVEEESYSLKDALTDIGKSLLDTFSSVATSLADIWSNQAEAIKASMEEQEEAGELTVAEKEKMQSEINELNRRAFETNKANSMAEATISLANTIIGIIEQCNGNPVAVAALSALATASWGAQVASIGSQQYTAMATGGIVTGPTHALIGEAGPEAIIPLKDKRAQEYLGTASPVQINITIEGNADEEVVFNAIERAQKTGMLPSWRYAN